MKKLLLILLVGMFPAAVFSQTSVSTTTNSNLSISVSKTKSDYTYVAVFDKEKSDKVREVLNNRLGKPNEETERTAIWEAKGYEVELRKGKVSVEASKEKLTKAFLLKLEDLGEEVSEALGQQKAPTAPKPPRPGKGSEE